VVAEIFEVTNLSFVFAFKSQALYCRCAIPVRGTEGFGGNVALPSNTELKYVNRNQTHGEKSNCMYELLKVSTQKPGPQALCISRKAK
jgi:hypothetical protein